MTYNGPLGLTVENEWKVCVTEILDKINISPTTYMLETVDWELLRTRV